MATFAGTFSVIFFRLRVFLRSRLVAKFVRQHIWYAVFNRVASSASPADKLLSLEFYIFFADGAGQYFQQLFADNFPSLTFFPHAWITIFSMVSNFSAILSDHGTFYKSTCYCSKFPSSYWFRGILRELQLLCASSFPSHSRNVKPPCALFSRVDSFL